MTYIMLQKLREEQKLSQEELAEISGVSRTTISLLETNKATTVKLATLQKLAKALGVSVGYFFTKKV